MTSGYPLQVPGIMRSRRAILRAAGCGGIAALLPGCTRRAERTMVGFVVKQPEEQWFQDEWRYAGEAARAFDFDLIRIGAPDAVALLAAIDTLYARGAGGFVVCTPQTLMGPAIVARARATGLKVMSVDDRLIDARGGPIVQVPHLGISGHEIGVNAGRAAAAEAHRRGWSLGNTGVLRVSYDSLETARERTMGGVGAAITAGVPLSMVHDAPQRTTDTEGGLTAAAPVLGRNSAVKQWIILGLNDESVLGAVRAAEGAGIAAADMIGVGIGGSATATAEFAKASPTGFWGSILISPRRHGYDTAAAMYHWIAEGIRPPLVTLTTGELMTRANFAQLLAAAQQ